jgi:hypothetical protein
MMDDPRGVTQIDRFAKRLQRLIVKPADIEGRASALRRLIEGPDLRQRPGENSNHRTR